MITIDDTGPVRTITLTRPDKANALTADMISQITHAVDGAASMRVIILTGAGTVFSAGADLDAAKAGLATSPLWEELSGAVARSPCLTIAALNGTAAGGAMGMVLACDLRVAVPGAKFFYPVMRLGYLPQPSDPGRLRDLVGPARAKMILMAGQKITAPEAAAWGLVDRITDDPVAEAHSLAHAVCDAPDGHATAIKRMIDPVLQNGCS